MAVLLAWFSWQRAAPDRAAWQALEQRARRRSLHAGRVLSGPGWCLYAARSHGREHLPILDFGDRVRLLDWAPWSAQTATSATPLAELRQGPALAALDLELAADRSLLRVQAVRDVLGRRSLVYARSGQDWLFASGEHLLLADPGVSSALDRDYLEAYLTLRAPPARASAYAAVTTLAAGELLRIDAAGVRQEQQALTPDWRWREMNDAAIVEETRRLLLQATARCVSGLDCVGLSLSGGIDSLSVAHALSALPAPRPAVLAVTYGFDDWPEIDERALAAQAAGALGLAWTGLAADLLPPLAPAARRPICPDTPISSLYREFKEAAYARFAAAGAQLWLSGSFGDHLCASPAERLADAWRQRRVRALLRELGGVLREPKVRRDPALRRWGSWLLRRSPQPPPWALLDPGADARARLDRRWHAELAECSAFPRPAQALACLNGYAMHAAAGEHWYAARHDMGYADPFRDVDLSRWMLSLPADVHARLGQPKALLRRLLGPPLDPTVLSRPKSSDLTPFLLASCGPARSDLVAAARQGCELVAAIDPGLAMAVHRAESEGSPAQGALARFLLSYLDHWRTSQRQP